MADRSAQDADLRIFAAGRYNTSICCSPAATWFDPTNATSVRLIICAEVVCADQDRAHRRLCRRQVPFAGFGIHEVENQTSMPSWINVSTWEICVCWSSLANTTLALQRGMLCVVFAIGQ
jgi:hypothetical protein